MQNLLVASLLREQRLGGGEIGLYKFAFSKLVYLILHESDKTSDSWGGHTADYLINDALICPPVLHPINISL